MLETNRQREEDGVNKYYYGLPITSISVILPLLSLFRFVVDKSAFQMILFAGLFVTGTLFILNFRLRKPSNAKLGVLVTMTACVVCSLMVMHVYHKRNLPKAEHGPYVRQAMMMENVER